MSEESPEGRPRLSRRTVLVGAAALAAAGYFTTAAVVAKNKPGDQNAQSLRLTVLGTADLYCNIYNWDYFADAEFVNGDGDNVGLAKIRTLVEAVRVERAGEPILTIDAGDAMRGTPLAFYYAKAEPATRAVAHPMATAMNLVGYDAATVGDHEFNYGIDNLRAFQDQLDFPLLGANVVDAISKEPVFSPYVIKEFKVEDGRDLKVGVLGLSNPGVAIWDKAKVEGSMEFPGLVEQATRFVPELKAAGCDIIIVSAHSGTDGSSSYDDSLPVENASTAVAEQVPDIDAILIGHAHAEIPQRYVTNQQTGRKVLLCEPLFWGMRLAMMDFNFTQKAGRWVLESATSQTLNSNTVAEDPEMIAAVKEQHEAVVNYINSVIGTSTQHLLAARAVVEDVPILDFISYVQAGAVKANLAGPDALLPVLATVAPFNREASFPSGEVTVRDVAGLYTYDNTLVAVKVTGSQLKDYLEYSCRYFKRIVGVGPFATDDVTNAPAESLSGGIPDSLYDIVAGLDAALTYDVDIAQPVGSRILGLSYAGVPVSDTVEFVLTLNSYRRSGGGGFPHVSTAPLVYDQQVEVRQLLIDWVTDHQVIDPSEFASVDWRLVSGGRTITVA